MYRVQAVEKYGVGAGGTRNISGNSTLHEELEAELADLHNKEVGLTYTYMYLLTYVYLKPLFFRYA